MANDNQNTVLDEQTDVVDEKSTKRVRKTKPKATDGGSTASLFGIEPYQPKKNEEYMSEGQLEHFRQILLAWKAELMSEVDRTLNTMQDENTALPDVNDRATQEEEFAQKVVCRGTVAKNGLQESFAFVIFEKSCQNAIRLGQKAFVEY